MKKENNLKKTKMNLISCSFIILSCVLYKYGCILYYMIFLIPFLFIDIFKENYKKIHILKSLYSIFLFFLINSLLVIHQKPIISFDSVSSLVAYLNVIIICFINLFLYFSSFQSFFTRKDNIFFLLFLSIFFSVSVLYFLHSDKIMQVDFKYIVFFILLYVFFVKNAFNKDTCIKLNFLFSLSPLITVITSIIIMYFIIRAPICHENCYRMLGMVGFTYLLYFQIVSISSIVFLFLPEKYFLSKYYNLNRCLLLILLLFGACIQFEKFKFLIY